jgi:carnitine 3-dehydrogenase
VTEAGLLPQVMPRKVAVLGAGEIGCGWAALCASAGWPVTVFDASARGLERATAEVPRRARALVALERATSGIVERGLQEFTQGRSLLQTVTDADWVIEAIPEDLVAKQKLFETTEPLAPAGALLTSSSSGLAPADIFGRCRRQDRCLVTHPLNPPELIPLVEVVPSAHTNPAAVRRAEDYLHALGRLPIRINKVVPGYVVGRVAAAVWRECVDLVLSGVIDVDGLDRAVSLGPALGWAAAGPCLTYHLAAGEGGVTAFLQRLLASFEEWWAGLATWQRLDPEQQRALIRAIERAYKGHVAPLSHIRDRRLSSLLRALEEAREDQPSGASPAP